MAAANAGPAGVTADEG
nr:hypothetical protein [Escherichia coli]